MEGIKSSSHRSVAFNIQFWIVTVMIWLVSQPVSAQVVDYNVNVTGTCAPPYELDDGTVIEFDCGQIGRQQNEPSCKVNPLNELNKLCAYNDYSLSDLTDKQGDTVIGYSESRDGQFIRRLLTGTRQNNWNGQDFMADPTMLVSEGFAAVTSISGLRGGNSVMQIQRMIELNTETGFRFYSEAGQIEISKISGSNFIDKPDARLIKHPDGGTEQVTMTLEDGRIVTRELNRVRIVVTFAVFNGSQQNIRTYTTYNDCFGAAGCWSNPRQISQTSGLDQGLSVANIGSKFLYVMRRFAEGTEADTIVGSVDNRAGAGNPGKVFEIGDNPEICAFDQVTLPDPLSPRNAVSFRTNDFPWVSATANEFVLVYAERPRDPVTNACLNQGSRVMVRTSANGTKWSDPFEVSPVAGHAFQFMQSIACNDEFCNVLWYDTRNESLAYDALIGQGERAWETNPYIEDFDDYDEVLQKNLRFKRTADVYTTRINIAGNGDPVPNPQPERVSRYVVDDVGFEREVNLLNVQAFGGSEVAFNGDYISITELGDGNFFAAWTDWRRARAQRGTAPFDVPAPYTVPDPNLVSETDVMPKDDGSPASAPMPTSPGEPFLMPVQEQVAETTEQADAEPVTEVVAQTQVSTDRFLSAFAPRAEGLEDPNPSPGYCAPAGDANLQYDARAKDSEIYGADIEDRVRLVSPTPAKNYCVVVDPATGNCIAGGLIQRAFVLGLNNDIDTDREFKLVIANQPGNPVKLDGDTEILEYARASWRQLPFGPTFDQSCDPEDDPFCVPDVVETRLIPGLSSDYVTLFVVSQTSTAPVTVLAYDDNDELVAELTVNGISAAGDLVNPGVVADVRLEEVHNPELFQPDWAGLDINLLNPSYRNPSYRNPSYRNPSYRNPSYRNPSYRNEAYSDSSSTDPTSTTSYDYENLLETDLLNSSLRNPSYRNGAPSDAEYDDTHNSFVDVTFGVGGDVNTVSSFNGDFVFAGDELDQFDTQVIAWRSNNVDTLQDCDPGQITESTVIAAVNNPDYSQLKVATIENNLDGSISFTTPVRGITNITIRIFGDGGDLEDLVKFEDQDCNPFGEEDVNQNGVLDPGEDTDGNGALDFGACSVLQKKIGWAFAAQAANTNVCNKDLPVSACKIIKDQTLVIKDVIPPSFSPEFDREIYSFPTDEDGGTPEAAATIDLVAERGLTAYDNCDPTTGQDCSASVVGVTCTITNGITGEEGPFAALGSNPATCSTAADLQGNVNTWNGFVFIADNEAPVINIPATELIVAPDSAEGAVVNYEGKNVWDDPEAEITVTDNIFRDDPPYDYPQLSCDKPSGSTFDYGSTTVTCTAFDAGPCDGASSSCVVEDIAGIPVSYNKTTASFNVVVQDSDPPDFTCLDDQGQPIPCGDSLDPIEKEATAENTPVTLTAPDATDVAPANPPVGAYVDASCITPAPTVFPLGTTVITWCATDFAFNTSTITQAVTIVDTTDPVISLQDDIVGQTTSGTLSISYNVTATDEVGVDSIDCVDTDGTVTVTATGGVFPVGTTSVTCTARDTEGNPAADPVPEGSKATVSFDVTVEFQYSASGISGKSSGKNGSSFPLEWAWIGPSGTPDTVSNQTLSIAREVCTDDPAPPGARNPGSSGLRQNTDGSYIYNLQAVDPADGENWDGIPNGGEPFCFRVSLPTGELQQKQLTIRP